MHYRHRLSQPADAVASEISIPRGSRVPEPYWGYEDIGIFFMFLVLLTPVFRLVVHFRVLLRSELINPSIGLQVGVVGFASLALYLVKLRHHQQVLKPLGWVLPSLPYTVAALLLGISFASGVALYLRHRNQSTPPISVLELLVLGLVFGPLLEESLFRGCLLPLLAHTTGNEVRIPREENRRSVTASTGSTSN